jgi:myosin-5
MVNINNTKPHYVRCIKPNAENAPDKFDPDLVLAQLRCCGVIEAVRVSRAGFPNRTPHDVFYRTYRHLVRDGKPHHHGHTKDSIKTFCGQLSKLLSPNSSGESADLGSLGLQIGLSQVFLRRATFDQLEALKMALHRRCLIKIQAKQRQIRHSRWFRAAKIAILRTQCLLRAWLARRIVNSLRRLRASVVIQRNIRGLLARKVVGRLYCSLVLIQCCARRRQAQKLVLALRRTRAVTLISAAFRR